MLPKEVARQVIDRKLVLSGWVITLDREQK